MKKSFPWLHSLREIFIKCGQYGLWESQTFPNKEWLKATIKQRLTDLFKNEWYSTIENSSKCTLYRSFKHTFGFEKYLVQTPTTLVNHLIKYRTRNHKLPVETGSWYGIPLCERICELCKADVGDEFHYLLKCPEFSNERKQFLRPSSYTNANILTFEKLMDTTDKAQLVKLCKFIKIILIRVCR